MKNYIQLIRVKHWIKNLLIFLPLLFSKNLLNYSYLLKCLLAFLTFCLLSSIVYVYNDIKDIDNDRKHETKKTRPLASKKISIKNAYITILILSITLISICVILYFLENNKWFVYLTLILYLINNILYSNLLKKIVILDVFSIMFGFLLRVICGALVINVPISNWLYLLIVFGSLYLGFGKRRNELKKYKAKDTREVLNNYNYEFLDKHIYLCETLSIMSYSLWCFDDKALVFNNNNLLVWSIPVFLIILFRYNLNLEKTSDGDPVEVIFSDKLLMSLIFIFMIYIIYVIYIVK